MNLPKNLQYLRKKNKITQEELADKLEVTRQSVSKWETGEAYPETDKLIAISDFFCVSLDDLIRGKLTAENTEEAVKPCGDTGFAEHINKFSRGIAIGVFLILLGIAVCVAITGSAPLTGFAPLMEIMGGVAVVLFVAAAMFLFIYYGIAHDRFRKEHPVVDFTQDEAQIKAFTKKFNLFIACFVTAILVDVALLITLTSLIDADIIYAANRDCAYCFVTAGFFFLLSFLIGEATYLGVQYSKYNVAEYNKQTDKQLHPSSRSKLKDAICGAIMLTATGLFLVLGFVWTLWHPGWVVFPVGGIICGVVSAVMDATDNH